MPNKRQIMTSNSSSAGSSGYSSSTASECEKNWKPVRQLAEHKHLSRHSKRRPHRFSKRYIYDSDKAGDFKHINKKKRVRKQGNIHPSVGKSHAEEISLQRCTYDRFMCTSKLVLLHFFATLLIYFLVYPVINSVWCYFISVYGEMAILLKSIVDEPVYERDIASHFKNMRWLSWPPVTPESVSLLLASSIKDHLYFSRWCS